MVYYGLYGGSFDPIHNGHIRVAQSVLQQCRLSAIDFLPVASPAHRTPPQADFTVRMEMLTTALQDYPQLHANGCEMALSSPSFSYNTIAHLQAVYPQNHYCLIVGVDAFQSFDSWHRWQDILDRITIIVMTRSGYKMAENRPKWWADRQISLDALNNSEPKKTGIVALEVPEVAISSSQIRQRISDNRDILDCVPKSVYDCIRHYSLYR